EQALQLTDEGVVERKQRPSSDTHHLRPTMSWSPVQLRSLVQALVLSDSRLRHDEHSFDLAHAGRMRLETTAPDRALAGDTFFRARVVVAHRRHRTSR